MLYMLDTATVLGRRDGRIYIHINSYSDGSFETFAWEWHGGRMNTGDVFRWDHNGTAYFIRLIYDGHQFASLFCEGWRMPPTPANEPRRPWFNTNEANRRGTGFRPSEPGPRAYDSLPIDFEWKVIR